MGVLNLDRINQKLTKVELPDHDCHVNIKPLMAADVVRIQKDKELTPVEFAGKMLLATVTDDDGNMLFKTLADVLRLPTDAIETISQAVMDANGLNEKKVNPLPTPN